MSDNKRNYKIPFILSMILHVTLIVFLVTSVSFSPRKVIVAHVSPKEIVKAVTIDDAKVNAEVKKLKDEQRAKERKQQEHLNQLRRSESQARQKRQSEQKRLKNILAKQKELKKQEKIRKKMATERLEKLKQEQVRQKNVLDKLIKQNEKTEKTYKKRKDLIRKKKQAASSLLQKQLAAEQKELDNARNKYIEGVVDKYKALILNAIQQHWIYPPNVNKGLKCVLTIRLSPGGEVLSVAVLKSSGDAALDRSAMTAVYKASPLPIPTKQTLFDKFRVINLTARPES